MVTFLKVVGKQIKEGIGTYSTKSGEKYIGSWFNDQRSGDGTQIYANGSEYKGQWKNNRINVMVKWYLAQVAIMKVMGRRQKKWKGYIPI